MILRIKKAFNVEVLIVNNYANTSLIKFKDKYQATVAENSIEQGERVSERARDHSD